MLKIATTTTQRRSGDQDGSRSAGSRPLHRLP